MKDKYIFIFKTKDEWHPYNVAHSKRVIDAWLQSGKDEALIIPLKEWEDLEVLVLNEEGTRPLSKVLVERIEDDKV